VRVFSFVADEIHLLFVPQLCEISIHSARWHSCRHYFIAMLKRAQSTRVVCLLFGRRCGSFAPTQSVPTFAAQLQTVIAPGLFDSETLGSMQRLPRWFSTRFIDKRHLCWQGLGALRRTFGLHELSHPPRERHAAARNDYSAPGHERCSIGLFFDNELYYIHSSDELDESVGLITPTAPRAVYRAWHGAARR
jgi:hypothetical protein